MTYDISIIIPHRDSIHFLPKLFSSIPTSDRIEILLVDNSIDPIRKENIPIQREYNLLYSAPERGAGGARNVGIDNSHGKWLIFADADDYFTENAFDLFLNNIDSTSDIIYSCMGGIYIDTGELSNRGDPFTDLVQGYLSNKIPENDLRFKFSSPCCKMIRYEMIQTYNLRFDEVTASNDMYFSMLCGFYAKRIKAINTITYIATVSRGTLTKRRDFDVISSRYEVYLRYNKFLKENGFPHYQRSILYFVVSLCKMGVSPAFMAINYLIKYRQNPFIGYENWISTMKRRRFSDIKDKNYIVR